MINDFLANLDTVLLFVFALSALVGAALMLVLRHPMQVAMALISTMVFLGGIYGLLGVAARVAEQQGWLPTNGIESYILVMRLYDSPVGVATRAAREAPMPWRRQTSIRLSSKGSGAIRSSRSRRASRWSAEENGRRSPFPRNS